MSRPSVLVVDVEAGGGSRIERVLERVGCDVALAGPETAHTVAAGRCRMVVVHWQSRDADAAVRLIGRLRSTRPDVPIVFVAAHSSEGLAIAAFHAGASRYLREPWTDAMLADVVQPWLEREASGPGAGERPDRHAAAPALIGASPAIAELRGYVEQIAPSSSNVLITGETGTGKELVARLIHAKSERWNEPFVALNSAAIPDGLVESELFGYDRGAFTGAYRSKPGKLAVANRGTVFFDEIGDVGLPLQAKLLHAIENRQIHRLGGHRDIELDLRILAATNQHLEDAVRERRFRMDLYYRLNVVRIDLTPLRERREDVPFLVDHYVRHFNAAFRRRISGLSARAMNVLMAHDWPGNVRELRNVIEAIFVNLSEGTTDPVDIPLQVMRHLTHVIQAPVPERERLLQALIATNWNKTRAASQLRWSRMTLYRKMSRYNFRGPAGPAPP